MDVGTAIRKKDIAISAQVRGYFLQIPTGDLFSKMLIVPVWLVSLLHKIAPATGCS